MIVLGVWAFIAAVVLILTPLGAGDLFVVFLLLIVGSIATVALLGRGGRGSGS